MKTRISAVFTLLLMLAGVTAAQAPQMPKPGPEIQRLHYFLGTWTSQYEIKPGPMGPGGKMTSVNKNTLMPGGFFVETRTEGSGTMGAIKSLAIWGYDPAQKMYTYDAFNNFGGAEHFKGTLQGDTWTWTSEAVMDGKQTRQRFSAREISPTMYTMKFDMSTGGDWATVMEGKSTKTSK